MQQYVGLLLLQEHRLSGIKNIYRKDVLIYFIFDPFRTSLPQSFSLQMIKQINPRKIVVACMQFLFIKGMSNGQRPQFWASISLYSAMYLKENCFMLILFLCRYIGTKLVSVSRQLNPPNTSLTSGLVLNEWFRQSCQYVF